LSSNNKMNHNQLLKRQLYLDDVYEYNNYVHKRQIRIISSFIFLLENNLNSDRRWHVRPMLYERPTLAHFNTIMSSSTFEDLLIIVGPSLQRSLSMPDILSVREIVRDTLRYLASGESMVLFKPSTDGWLKIANEFEAKWKMPHCVGALDGKRIAFTRSGSVNFNHKGSHSTILMALCDANYNFTCVNI
ncbi:protein ANTAGONIST OF LIKE HETEROCHROMATIN PROTEIN 1-like, partial [Aphis craccivora]